MSGPDLNMLESYFRLMNTNGVAQVYHTALELGVLAALANSSMSAEEVANNCDLQPYATQLLLKALAAMGVVQPQGDAYALTAVTQMLLGSEYRELGSQYWRHLPQFLRTDQPLKKMDNLEKSEEYYQAQAAILGWMLSPAAQKAAEMLHARLGERALSILDVGAGSAVWSLSLARMHPTSHVTAIDWPAVLEVAAETADNFGLRDRLECIAGNCHEVEFPKNTFDLAIVANLSHLQTPEQNQALFAKVHDALRPNGNLVIVDAFAGSPSGDVPFALYHLGLALRTENGRVYSAEQLSDMLDANQFEPGELTPLDTPPHMVGMLVCSNREG